MARGRHDEHLMCTSLEAKPVTALVELLWACSTCGKGVHPACRVIVGVFDVGKVCIPAILEFVANHG